MNLSSIAKKVIVPLLIILVFAGVWYGLFRPEFRKISEYRRQPEAAREQIEQMVRQLSSYNPPDRQEREAWDSLGRRLESLLPEGRQLTELYTELSLLAEKHRLQNFQRNEIEGSDSTYQDGGITRNGYAVELTFDAGYSGLAGFLEDLRSLDRLVEVVSLEVTRNVPRVNVKTVVRSYYTPGPQEAGK